MNHQQVAFDGLRYGMFVHFGIYSSIGRGEWVFNREAIPREEYLQMGRQFQPAQFDAEALAELAVQSGMRYLVFTTMHHEGFRLYDSSLTDFCSTKTAAKRDFTQEIISACRKQGLKVGLYHSLNNWMDTPDGVDALESPAAYDTLLYNTHNRIRELVSRYRPIDILWYDGWWPFDANGWQAERMNAMVRKIQPHILFNGRNGLPGDFATPEQHLAAPQPLRPWEACVTLNDNWGYHEGDQNWKSPAEIITMLAKVAQSRGNLLLNVGPDGDGRLPAESIKILRSVGEWLKVNGECIWEADPCTVDPYVRGDHRGDWSHHGTFTIRDNALYLVATSQPQNQLVINGLDAVVREVTCLGKGHRTFLQIGRKITVELSPGEHPGLPLVYKFTCDRPPSLYGTGGLRIPAVEHPRYDPLPSDIGW